jgi:4-amino-4-deoxy-L-arabinose transferase-like glycosyltransferase
LTLPARRTLLLIAALAIAWFALLGGRDLVEPDEGRYAEIPREMLASGDWLTPRLNGFKYFEKPPLQYWLTAAGYAVLGVGTGSARLWPALLGLLGAGVAALLAARLYGPAAGLRALLVLLTSLLYLAMGHILTLDMAVSVFLFAGVACLVLAQRGRAEWSRARRWMWLGWAALAAATLSKGLIGVVLPGMAVLLYSAWQRDWALWRHLELGRGLALLLALTAPWFVAVSVHNPGFAWFFFVHEHLQRYTTDVHQRGEPLWYFVPVLLLGTLPWCGALLRVLLRPGFPWRRGAGGFSAERFLWVFAVVTFVFFSAGDSKLPPYILPMLPALAVLAAPRLAAQRERAMPVLALLMAGALAALAWAGPRFANQEISAQRIAAYMPWFYAAAAAYAGAALCAWRAEPQAWLRQGAAALALLAGLQLCAWGYRVAEPSRSSRTLAEAILAEQPGDAPVYAVEAYPQTLPFYLGRTVLPVGEKGEMAMGIAMEPARWIATREEFARRWLAEPRAFAVLRLRDLAWARAQALPMRELARNGWLVVVSRR